MLSIIAAVSENNVLGLRNALPWRIPEDLARFKKLTMGHVLVMGRKTFESIGRALPGRTTVVLTRRDDFAMPDVLVAHDREEAITLVAGREAYVAGGAEIYTTFFPLSAMLYLTRVHGDFEGDTFFPRYDASQWRLVSEEPHPGTPPFTFQVYARSRPPESV